MDRQLTQVDTPLMLSSIAVLSPTNPTFLHTSWIDSSKNQNCKHFKASDIETNRLGLFLRVSLKPAVRLTSSELKKNRILFQTNLLVIRL